MSEPMKAGLYARVSTEDQVEKFGLPLQVRAFHEYLDRYGLEDAGEEHHYIDEGYSGSTLDRPGLDALRATLKDGPPFDVLMTYDEDRIARHRTLFGLVLFDFEDAGVRLRTKDQRPDEADTPETDLLRGIKAELGQYSKAQFLERSRRGRLEKAQKGLVVGGHPPFGYRYIKGEGRLEVDDREAAIVRRVMELLVSEKLTTRKLVVRLQELGVPTPSAVRAGGKQADWNKSSVARILRQEAYIGKAHYNKSKRVEPKRRTKDTPYNRNQRSTNVRRPREEWIEIPVPSIVSQELWDAAQVQLSRNTELHSRNVKYQHLLRGFIFCGECRLRWYSMPSHGKRYYRCAKCRKSISAPRLEDAVWAKMRELIEHPEMIRQHAVKVAQEESIDAAVIRANLEMAERQLEDARREEERLLDKAIQDVFNSDVLHRKAAALAEARIKAEKHMMDMKARLEMAESGAARIQGLTKVCAAVAERLDELDFDAKRWLLDMLNVTLTAEDGKWIMAGAVQAPEPIQIERLRLASG